MTRKNNVDISNLLKHGENNAVPVKELLALTGYKSERSLKEAIRRERENGAPILSRYTNGGGYYLPSNDEELIKGIKTQIAKNSTSNYIYRNILKESQISGQMKMTDKDQIEKWQSVKEKNVL